MSATAWLCVLMAAAHVVAGKPHQCFVDDYARALLGQLDPAATTTTYDHARDEPRAFRTGRSDDAEGLDADPSYRVGDSERGADRSEEPCKTAGRPDVVQKLVAYRQLLESQQEALARQQLQHQLYEQQRQRQQEYMAVQRQIQQQYYQQQQHALRVLEQLRKNPEFAVQLAAFIDRKRADDGENNGNASAVPGTEAEGRQRSADRTRIGEETRPDAQQTGDDDDDGERVDDEPSPLYYTD